MPRSKRPAYPSLFATRNDTATAVISNETKIEHKSGYSPSVRTKKLNEQSDAELGWVSTQSKRTKTFCL